MSSATWTPGALSSEARKLSGSCWRLVEAQHRVSTLKLVDTIDDQALLESLIDQIKPPVPPECRHLHFLLSTPFRYDAPYPSGSRFRRPGMTPGVFYGSESPATAVAELAFHRLLFFAESPATPWPKNPGEYTAFSVGFAVDKAIDLTLAPLSSDQETWTHPTAYGACQDLADGAREAAIQAIRYVSVRDPDGGVNLALLECAAFTTTEPAQLQTWRLNLGAAGVQAICEFPRSRLGYDRSAFADDVRIASLQWQR